MQRNLTTAVGELLQRPATTIGDMEPVGERTAVSVRAVVNGGVVVGHDGSQSAHQAPSWAAALAE